MITPAALISSADEIDNRLGPVTGRSSDRIARELRQAAKLITELQLSLTNLHDDQHQGKDEQ